MTENASFYRGVLAGILLALGGQAVYWFVTPMSHPDASALRAAAVAVQAAVGFGGALWLFIRQRFHQEGAITEE